ARGSGVMRGAWEGLSAPRVRPQLYRCKMRITILMASLLTVVALFPSDASAQEARTYKYCLEQGMPMSFPLMTCYYNTLEQCMASKTGPSDRCMINPQWRGKRS